MVIHNIDDVSETYKRTKTPREKAEKERNKERKKFVLFKHVGFTANKAYEAQ